MHKIRVDWSGNDSQFILNSSYFDFFMILTYGVYDGPFQVAQLYWLPVFNIAIYITQEPGSYL